MASKQEESGILHTHVGTCVHIKYTSYIHTFTDMQCVCMCAVKW